MWLQEYSPSPYPGFVRRYLDFFLEADRSTMTDGDYLAKLRAYWLFWKQERQKADQRLEARDAFRVLTVCKTLIFPFDAFIQY